MVGGVGVGGHDDAAAHLAVDLHRAARPCRRPAAPGRPRGTARRPASRSWPSRAHSSSATCGASGASISTSGSATSRGARRRAPTRVRWLFSSISLAMAVLNAQRRPCRRARASMVRCSSRRVVVVGRRRRRPAARRSSSSTTLRHSRCRNRYTPTTARVSHGRDCVERAHRHLVQPQRVGAVLVVHVVGRDRVLQALAHLARTRGVTGSPLVRRSAPSRSSTSAASTYDAALVGVRVGLDVALVEQPVERLAASTRGPGRTAPCARTGRTAGAARRARRRRRTGRRRRRRPRPAAPSSSARPPGRRSAFVVGRVEVAQLVPARAGPLRHRVGLAAVALRPVAQVELDVDPVGRRGPAAASGSESSSSGSKVCGRVVVDLGQLDRQHRLGQRDAAARPRRRRSGTARPSSAGG